ncbi:TlpA family protein disulfide reductase [Variovorax sp. ZT4R33]|uniref:TlpA family protein disulfide reductase n=1 Tax=Variovorax sp. ZT4R33 TaxID=3443743 RepID=UPI003F44AFD7
MTRPSTSRRAWLLGGVAAAAGVAGAGTAWWRHATGAGATPAGEQLPSIFWSSRFERPEGGQLEMASLRGKPLLLNFWATWCPPCVEELPMVDRFFREQAANGWQVVGLAIDRPESVRKFLTRTPVSFPIGITGLDGTELVRELGNTGGGLPFTLVLAADGSVAARKMGQLLPADLDTWRRAEVHS